MNGPLRKDLYRSIKASFPRFASIVAIIALGISFFVGMKSASPDMKITANKYFVDNNLMDIQVASTIGFTSEEIKKISAVDGVRTAGGVKCADTLVFSGENGIVNASNGAAMACRVMSMDFKKAEKFTETGEADDSYINRVNLVDGRYPQKKNECVVDFEASKRYAELAIGRVITLSGEDTTLEDTFKTLNYKIVGTVSSPMYVSFERGTTNIASGTLGMYLYVKDECFATDNYTDAYVVIENKENYDVYSQEYADAVKSVSAEIEKISQSSISARLADVKKEYSEKIKKNKKAYSKLEKETTKELEKALSEIDKIQDYIDNGDSIIAADKKSLQAKVKSAKAQLAASKERYDNSKAVYESDKANARDQGNQYTGAEKARQIYNDYYYKLKEDRKEIDAMRAEVSSYSNKVNSAKDAYNKAESDYKSICDSLSSKESELKSAQADLEKSKSQLNEWTEESTVSYESLNAKVRDFTAKCNRLSNDVDSLKSKRSQADNKRVQAKEEYDNASKDYNNFSNTIDNRESEYEKNLQVLIQYQDDIERLEKGEQALSIFQNELTASGNALLASKIAITESQLRLYYEESTGNQKIKDEEADLKAAKTRLETAEKNYSETEHNVKIQLNNAQGDIEKNELLLDELNNSAWLISNQTELPGHESYGQSLENINAIANVFPAIFFIIAAFMCLATMTRMVQEERMQLGTLKALGYGGFKILMKYYCYAALACLAGSVIGAAAGTLLFPRAVDTAYGMVYNLPKVRIIPDWKYVIIGSLFYLVVTLISTAIACRSELKVNAAHLMRPKAPLPGKRIFIERFSTIWNILSFGSVITMRNMFRSKRRMVMTILGVACCTTLILSAFGLSNSVDKIISAQYGEEGVAQYDVMVTLDEAQIPNESETLEEIKNDIRVKDAMLLITKTMTAYSAANPSSAKISAHVVIPQRTEGLSSFISLRTRKGNEKIIIGARGAVVSEKLAKDTGVSVGDILTLKNTADEKFAVEVSAVTENYLDHYIYISPDYFSEVFDEKPEYKNIVLSLENFTASGDEQNLADDLLAYSSVKGVASTDIMIESFNGVIDRLDVIIIIFIVAAGLLALIILYNLTNISVQERIREIATIKVLGFTDSEMTSYVYRENIFLTAVGILIGLAGGTLLHKAVINIAEVNVAMFGREIYWWSYVLAAVMTALFAAGVCFLVHRRLKSLDTVAALKSVE